MDPADRKNCVLHNREQLLHPLKASGKVWQIYEEKGLELPLALYVRKRCPRMWKPRGWIVAGQGCCLLGSDCLQSKGRAEKYRCTLTAWCSSSGWDWESWWILWMGFCTGTCASNCRGAARRWHREQGSFLPPGQVCKTYAWERGWGKEKRKGNTAQRCTDIRTEFTCKVSLSSVASKPAWEVGIQESVCICVPLDRIAAWLLQELY